MSEQVVCEGCRTGNQFLCKSFPGVAPEHARREAQWVQREIRRQRAVSVILGTGTKWHRRKPTWDEVGNGVGTLGDAIE